MEVGKVEAIEFDREQPGRILVKIGVLPTTPVTTATFAELGMQGLTGLAYIQLGHRPQGQGPGPGPFQLACARAPGDPAFTVRPLQHFRRRPDGQCLHRHEPGHKLLSDGNQKLLVQTLANLQGVSARLGQLADEVKPAAVGVSNLAADGRKALGRACRRC